MSRFWYSEVEKAKKEAAKYLAPYGEISPMGENPHREDSPSGAVSCGAAVPVPPVEIPNDPNTRINEEEPASPAYGGGDAAPEEEDFPAAPDEFPDGEDVEIPLKDEFENQDDSPFPDTDKVKAILTSGPAAGTIFAQEMLRRRRRDEKTQEEPAAIAVASAQAPEDDLDIF
jgi:hypothetical protein